MNKNHAAFWSASPSPKENRYNLYQYSNGSIESRSTTQCGSSVADSHNKEQYVLT